MALSYVFVKVIFPYEEFAFFALGALIAGMALRTVLELMSYERITPWVSFPTAFFGASPALVRFGLCMLVERL
jgi:ABC-type branched-subunit amino acid transport system permease subunit